MTSLEQGKLAPSKAKREETEDYGQTVFNLNETNGVITKLRDLSIDALTPIEALNILFELKKLAE